MRARIAGVAVAVLLAAACEQRQTEEATLVGGSTGPVTAAELSTCPTASEDGHVAIFPGLDATILRKGYGRAVLLGDDVVVKARLWVYDAAADSNKGEFVWDAGPDGFAFQLGASGFIEGWSPGIACMLVGERRELVIASELAYGAGGRAPIPPNAAIIYDLELVKVAEPES